MVKPKTSLPKFSLPATEEPVLFSVVGLNQLNFGDGTETCPMRASDFVEEKEIGSGRFGFVHRMRHIGTNKVVAVKKIQIITFPQNNFKELEREFKAMLDARNHPNIVQYFGALQEEGCFWIFMQLMDCSLHKFYTTVHHHNLPLPEANFMHIAIGAICGLQHLKTQKIVHRDVKPQNILLDRGGAVQLCDFGVSCQLVDSVAASLGTGTQNYFAPERLINEPFGAPADLWALGVSLLEVANGEFPFPKWTNVPHQVSDLVNLQIAPKPLNERFSPDCRQFVASFMKYDPSERPKYQDLTEDPYCTRMMEMMANDSNYLRYFDEVIGGILTMS